MTVCECPAHQYLGRECECFCDHSEDAQPDFWATGMVAEVLPGGNVIIWPDDDINKIALYLDKIGEKGRNRRNYFLVDVSLSPSEV